MRSILFVQHGDFAEAYNRFARGELETYRDQKISVDFVAGQAPASKVTTLSFGTNSDLTKMAHNLWIKGGAFQSFDKQKISALFDQMEVTHLILRTPHADFLHEASRRKIPTLPVFADIFGHKSFQERYRSWKFRQALMKCQAPCFSNHSLNASRSLAEALKLPTEKIVPWDWTKVPVVREAKSGVAHPNRPTAFFAGTLSEDKGVGDCLNAIALLRQKNIFLEMSFAGPGDISAWMGYAGQLGIINQVNFCGMIPNAEVRAEMHRHDFVVVPSRHSYNEGLPNTIYEGLASRSALVISDHPAFAGRLKPDNECLVFAAADPTALSACLERVILDKELYRQLSRNSSKAHDQLYVGMEWTALVTAFLDDPVNQSGWVQMNALNTIESS